ncbi:MAG: hypothetical protein ACHQ2Z_05260 [Elusimicrobiota bacterium]
MHDRKTSLITVVALAAALAAVARAAETFENSVNGALDASGPVKVRIGTQKDVSVQTKDQMQKDAASDAQADSVGGQRPGPRPPAPHPPRPPHPPHPPRPPHPTHPTPPNRNHQKWGKWKGHPGWGRDRRWDWDRYGRPHWWGWVIWEGERRAQCLDYYAGELHGCNDSCADENAKCVQACDAYHDADCAAQCESNSQYCRDSCSEDYDQRVQTCPAFLNKN